MQFYIKPHKYYNFFTGRVIYKLFIKTPLFTISLPYWTKKTNRKYEEPKMATGYKL